MVSLGWYVLAVMLIVNVIASEAGDTNEYDHLQNEHAKILKKITDHIVDENQHNLQGKGQENEPIGDDDDDERDRRSDYH